MNLDQLTRRKFLTGAGAAALPAIGDTKAGYGATWVIGQQASGV